jgi:hypothetical protein
MQCASQRFRSSPRIRTAQVVLWIVLSLVVSSAAAGSNDAPAVAERKEFTPGCLPTPIPVQPQGQVASREISRADGARMRVSLWRYPCTGGDAQALLTFTPLSGTPSVDGIRLRQAGREARFPDLVASAAPLTFLFGPIDGPVSAVISANLSPPFDDDCAFSVDYLPRDGVAQSLALAAETGAACALDFGTAGAVLSARLGGTWFDPARDGEGVLLDFFRIGDRSVAFVSWYAYEGGQQRYLVGAADYAAGDRSVRVPLIETGGAQFGAAFRPGDVIRRNWGEATLSFADCRTLRMAWTRADGTAATLNLIRAGVADGVDCP